MPMAEEVEAYIPSDAAPSYRKICPISRHLCKDVNLLPTHGTGHAIEMPVRLSPDHIHFQDDQIRLHES